MSSPSIPTRSVPDKPSLAQLKKQAKELLKQRLRQGEGRTWNPEAAIWNLKIMA